jgi:hypothetical protein
LIVFFMRCSFGIAKSRYSVEGTVGTSVEMTIAGPNRRVPCWIQR